MKCPDCHVTLTTRELEPGLAARACGQCGGQWVEGVRYFRWLESRPKGALAAGTAERAANSSVATPVHGVVERRVRARLCPACGRLLMHAKVGHGTPFELDRCGGCGGIWLDAHEWETLKRHDLHDDVHLVFSSAWQADVARRDRERERDNMLLNKVGPADLDEAKRVRSWLDAHPRRAELYAILLDGAEGVAPPSRKRA